MMVKKEKLLSPLFLNIIAFLGSVGALVLGSGISIDLRWKICIALIVIASIGAGFISKGHSDKEMKDLYIINQQQNEKIRVLNKALEVLSTSQSVLLVNSMPSHRAIKLVSNYLCEKLSKENDWKKLRYIFSDGKTFSCAYYTLLKNDNIEKIFWLYSDEINHLLTRQPDGKMLECFWEIYKKVEIDQEHTVDSAWNILLESFLPVLVIAFKTVGYGNNDSKNHCISVGIKPIDKRLLNVNAYHQDNRNGEDFYMLDFPEKILEQLIGKNRIEISQIILKWVYNNL